GCTGRRRRRGAAARGARRDGGVAAPRGRLRARAGRHALRVADTGRGAGRGDPRARRRARRLGGSPPVRSRAGHRGAARRHHTILRVAGGPPPDAGRRQRGRNGTAGCGAGGAGSEPRGERPARGRLRRGPALLHTRPRAGRPGCVRLLPDLLRARRHPVQRPARGARTVLGVVALCAASVLWRRGLARRWWNVVGAAGLVLAAPFLVRYLGRGIAPPAGGVGFALWMSWEAAVATAAMALVLTAAALVRGARDPH